MRSMLLVIALAHAAHAEPGPAFSMDVFELADQRVNIAVDVPTAKHIVLRAEIATDMRKNDGANGGDYHGGGLAAVAGRWFFLHALEGPFVDVEVRTRDFNFTDPTQEMHHYLAWSPRMLAGYEHVVADHVTLAAAVGIGHEWITRDDGGESSDDDVYIASIRLGYAF